jgi:uncharacterized BrkB/YihY/UPF0761 family membrane protein
VRELQQDSTRPVFHIMQLLLIIIEIFLPEIASALSGSQSHPLRIRLFRAGIGIIVVCLVYLLIVAIYRYLFNGVDHFYDMLSGYEITSLSTLAVLGIGLLLLSKTKTKQS